MSHTPSELAPSGEISASVEESELSEGMRLRFTPFPIPRLGIARPLPRPVPLTGVFLGGFSIT